PLAIKELRQRNDVLATLADELLEGLGRNLLALLQVGHESLLKLFHRFLVEIELLGDAHQKLLSGGDLEQLLNSSGSQRQFARELLQPWGAQPGGADFRQQLCP